MKAKSVENIKDQIGYCGIWCGSCLVGNGGLGELTSRYKKIIKKYDVEMWAPKYFDFKEFKRGLDSIEEESFCAGCLKGGGRPDCEIKSCAISRDVSDCCECNEFMACKNSEMLGKMRKGAKDAGLLVKDKDVGRKEFLDKGINELKKNFPTCIQTCNTT